MQRASRGSRTVLATFVAALAFALFAAAAAASSIPKWLKPPYEHYTLTYEANDSSHGSIETSTPNPPAGFGTCDFAGAQEQGSQSLHAVVRYAFVFGRYRSKVAFTYKLAGRSVTGRDALVDHEGYAAGCPPGGRFPEGPETGECTQAIGFTDPPELELGANAASTKFGLSLATSVDSLGEPACNGNPQVYSGLHPAFFDWGAENGEVPMPSVAYMTFTASGIKARHTFQGRVTTKPEKAARSGGGTQPEPGGEQVKWSFADSPSYSLTLAPAGHP